MLPVLTKKHIYVLIFTLVSLLTLIYSPQKFPPNVYALDSNNCEGGYTFRGGDAGDEENWFYSGCEEETSGGDGNGGDDNGSDNDDGDYGPYCDEANWTNEDTDGSYECQGGRVCYQKWSQDESCNYRDRGWDCKDINEDSRCQEQVEGPTCDEDWWSDQETSGDIAECRNGFACYHQWWMDSTCGITELDDLHCTDTPCGNPGGDDSCPAVPQYPECRSDGSVYQTYKDCHGEWLPGVPTGDSCDAGGGQGGEDAEEQSGACPGNQYWNTETGQCTSPTNEQTQINDQIYCDQQCGGSCAGNAGAKYCTQEDGSRRYDCSNPDDQWVAECQTQITDEQQEAGIDPTPGGAQSCGYADLDGGQCVGVQYCRMHILYCDGEPRGGAEVGGNCSLVAGQCGVERDAGGNLYVAQVSCNPECGQGETCVTDGNNGLGYCKANPQTPVNPCEADQNAPGCQGENVTKSLNQAEQGPILGPEQTDATCQAMNPAEHYCDGNICIEKSSGWGGQACIPVYKNVRSTLCDNSCGVSSADSGEKIPLQDCSTFANEASRTKCEAENKELEDSGRAAPATPVQTNQPTAPISSSQKPYVAASEIAGARCVFPEACPGGGVKSCVGKIEGTGESASCKYDTDANSCGECQQAAPDLRRQDNRCSQEGVCENGPGFVCVNNTDCQKQIQNAVTSNYFSQKFAEGAECKQLQVCDMPDGSAGEQVCNGKGSNESCDLSQGGGICSPCQAKGSVKLNARATCNPQTFKCEGAPALEGCSNDDQCKPVVSTVTSQAPRSAGSITGSNGNIFEPRTVCQNEVVEYNDFIGNLDSQYSNDLEGAIWEQKTRKEVVQKCYQKYVDTGRAATIATQVVTQNTEYYYAQREAANNTNKLDEYAASIARNYENSPADMVQVYTQLQSEQQKSLERLKQAETTLGVAPQASNVLDRTTTESRVDAIAHVNEVVAVNTSIGLDLAEAQQIRLQYERSNDYNPDAVISSNVQAEDDPLYQQRITEAEAGINRLRELGSKNNAAVYEQQLETLPDRVDSVRSSERLVEEGTQMANLLEAHATVQRQAITPADISFLQNAGTSYVEKLESQGGVVAQAQADALENKVGNAAYQAWMAEYQQEYKAGNSLDPEQRQAAGQIVQGLSTAADQVAATQPERAQELRDQTKIAPQVFAVQTQIEQLRAGTIRDIVNIGQQSNLNTEEVYGALQGIESSNRSATRQISENIDQICQLSRLQCQALQAQVGFDPSKIAEKAKADGLRAVELQSEQARLMPDLYALEKAGPSSNPDAQAQIVARSTQITQELAKIDPNLAAKSQAQLVQTSQLGQKQNQEDFAANTYANNKELVLALERAKNSEIGLPSAIDPQLESQAAQARMHSAINQMESVDSQKAAAMQADFNLTTYKLDSLPQGNEYVNGNGCIVTSCNGNGSTAQNICSGGVSATIGFDFACAAQNGVVDPQTAWDLKLNSNRQGAGEDVAQKNQATDNFWNSVLSGQVIESVTEGAPEVAKAVKSLPGSIGQTFTDWLARDVETKTPSFIGDAKHQNYCRENTTIIPFFGGGASPSDCQTDNRTPEQKGEIISKAIQNQDKIEDVLAAVDGQKAHSDINRRTLEKIAEETGVDLNEPVVYWTNTQYDQFRKKLEANYGGGLFDIADATIFPITLYDESQAAASRCSKDLGDLCRIDVNNASSYLAVTKGDESKYQQYMQNVKAVLPNTEIVPQDDLNWVVNKVGSVQNRVDLFTSGKNVNRSDYASEDEYYEAIGQNLDSNYRITRDQLIDDLLLDANVSNLGPNGQPKTREEVAKAVDAYLALGYYGENVVANSQAYNWQKTTEDELDWQTILYGAQLVTMAGPLEFLDPTNVIVEGTFKLAAKGVTVPIREAASLVDNTLERFVRIPAANRAIEQGFGITESAEQNAIRAYYDSRIAGQTVDQAIASLNPDQHAFFGQATSAIANKLGLDTATDKVIAGTVLDSVLKPVVVGGDAIADRGTIIAGVVQGAENAGKLTRAELANTGLLRDVELEALEAQNVFARGTSTASVYDNEVLGHQVAQQVYTEEGLAPVLSVADIDKAATDLKNRVAQPAFEGAPEARPRLVNGQGDGLRLGQATEEESSVISRILAPSAAERADTASLVRQWDSLTPDEKDTILAQASREVLTNREAARQLAAQTPTSGSQALVQLGNQARLVADQIPSAQLNRATAVAATVMPNVGSAVSAIARGTDLAPEQRQALSLSGIDETTVRAAVDGLTDSQKAGLARAVDANPRLLADPEMDLKLAAAGLDTDEAQTVKTAFQNIYQSSLAANPTPAQPSLGQRVADAWNSLWNRQNTPSTSSTANSGPASGQSAVTNNTTVTTTRNVDDGFEMDTEFASTNRVTNTIPTGESTVVGPITQKPQTNIPALNIVDGDPLAGKVALGNAMKQENRFLNDPEFQYVSGGKTFTLSDTYYEVSGRKVMLVRFPDGTATWIYQSNSENSWKWFGGWREDGWFIKSDKGKKIMDLPFDMDLQVKDLVSKRRIVKNNRPAGLVKTSSGSLLDGFDVAVSNPTNKVLQELGVLDASGNSVARTISTNQALDIINSVDLDKPNQIIYNKVDGTVEAIYLGATGKVRVTFYVDPNYAPVVDGLRGSDRRVTYFGERKVPFDINVQPPNGTFNNFEGLPGIVNTNDGVLIHPDWLKLIEPVSNSQIARDLGFSPFSTIQGRETEIDKLFNIAKTPTEVERVVNAKSPAAAAPQPAAPAPAAPNPVPQAVTPPTAPVAQTVSPAAPGRNFTVPPDPVVPVDTDPVPTPEIIGPVTAVLNQVSRGVTTVSKGLEWLDRPVNFIQRLTSGNSTPNLSVISNISDPAVLAARSVELKTQVPQLESDLITLLNQRRDNYAELSTANAEIRALQKQRSNGVTRLWNRLTGGFNNVETQLGIKKAQVDELTKARADLETQIEANKRQTKALRLEQAQVDSKLTPTTQASKQSVLAADSIELAKQKTELETKNKELYITYNNKGTAKTAADKLLDAKEKYAQMTALLAKDGVPLGEGGFTRAEQDKWLAAYRRVIELEDQAASQAELDAAREAANQVLGTVRIRAVSENDFAVALANLDTAEKEWAKIVAENNQLAANIQKLQDRVNFNQALVASSANQANILAAQNRQLLDSLVPSINIANPNPILLWRAAREADVPFFLDEAGVLHPSNTGSQGTWVIATYKKGWDDTISLDRVAISSGAQAIYQESAKRMAPGKWIPGKLSGDLERVPKVDFDKQIRAFGIDPSAPSNPSAAVPVAAPQISTTAQPPIAAAPNPVTPTLPQAVPANTNTPPASTLTPGKYIRFDPQNADYQTFIRENPELIIDVPRTVTGSESNNGFSMTSTKGPNGLYIVKATEKDVPTQDAMAVSQRSDGVINLVVADGVGEALAADFTARLAAGRILEELSGNPLQDQLFRNIWMAIQTDAHREIAQSLIDRNPNLPPIVRSVLQEKIDKNSIGATTVSVVQYDPKTGLVRYGVHGDSPIIVFKKDGSTPLVIEGISDNQLGYKPGSTYDPSGLKSGQLSLQPGDVVVVMSDGTNDARFPNIYAQIAERVKSGDTDAQIAEFIKSRMRAEGIKDDVSVGIIQRQAQTAATAPTVPTAPAAPVSAVGLPQNFVEGVRMLPVQLQVNQPINNVLTALGTNVEPFFVEIETSLQPFSRRVKIDDLQNSRELLKKALLEFDSVQTRFNQIVNEGEALRVEIENSNGVISPSLRDRVNSFNQAQNEIKARYKFLKNEEIPRLEEQYRKPSATVAKIINEELTRKGLPTLSIDESVDLYLHLKQVNQTFPAQAAVVPPVETASRVVSAEVNNAADAVSDAIDAAADGVRAAGTGTPIQPLTDGIANQVPPISQAIPLVGSVVDVTVGGLENAATVARLLGNDELAEALLMQARSLRGVDTSPVIRIPDGSTMVDDSGDLFVEGAPDTRLTGSVPVADRVDDPFSDELNPIISLVDSTGIPIAIKDISDPGKPKPVSLTVKQLEDTNLALAQAVESGRITPELSDFWRGLVRDAGELQSDGSFKPLYPYIRVDGHYFYGFQPTVDLSKANFIKGNLALRDYVTRSLRTPEVFSSPSTFRTWLQNAHREVAYKPDMEPGALETRKLHSEGHVEIANSYVKNVARDLEDIYYDKLIEVRNSNLDIYADLHLPGISPDGKGRDWIYPTGIDHSYPDPRFRDQYFEQMRLRMQQLVINKDLTLEEQLQLIAETYQYGVAARSFKEVNNSLYMGIANTLLAERGLKPINAGFMDFAAMRLQQENFTELFIREVEKTNPNVNVRDGLLGSGGCILAINASHSTLAQSNQTSNVLGISTGQVLAASTGPCGPLESIVQKVPFVSNLTPIIQTAESIDNSLGNIKVLFDGILDRPASDLIPAKAGRYLYYFEDGRLVTSRKSPYSSSLILGFSSVNEQLVLSEAVLPNSLQTDSRLQAEVAKLTGTPLSPQIINNLVDGRLPEVERAIVNQVTANRSIDQVLHWNQARVEADNAIQQYRTQKIDRPTLIQTIEKIAGIDTPALKLSEAILVIDDKFVTAGAIGGNNTIEQSFGDTAWSDWLNARIATRAYGDQPLTVDFMKNLHVRLTDLSNPRSGGIPRNEQRIGADYTNVGNAVTYTTDQVQAIKENPLLNFQQSGDDPNTGFIIYPSTKNELGRESLENLSDQAKTKLGPNPAEDKLVEVLLEDLVEWYNANRKYPFHDPYKLAAELQRRFVSIHPFEDVNGRVSRALMNWSLENEGLPPAYLADPNNDLLSSLDSWAEQVKQGSERYAELEQRRQDLEKIGYTNQAEILGLGEDKTFYDLVYSKTSQVPTKSNPWAELSHTEYDQFLANLQQAKQEFDGQMKGERNGINAGGLVPQTYIDLLTIQPKDHLIYDEYLKKYYFSNRELYRGGKVTESIQTDNDILQLFEQPTAVGAGYYSLFGKSPMSTVPLNGAEIAASLKKYNQLIVDQYAVVKEPPPGGGPLIKVVRDQTGPTGDILESPFASTSTSRTVARSFATVALDPVGKTGILFTISDPKQGNIFTFKDFEQTTYGFPGLNDLGVRLGKKEENEVLIPGGIIPANIKSIEIYNYSDTGKILKRAEKIISEGEEVILITNPNLPLSNPLAYQLNPQTGKYQIIDYKLPVFTPEIVTQRVSEAKSFDELQAFLSSFEANDPQLGINYNTSITGMVSSVRYGNWKIVGIPTEYGLRDKVAQLIKQQSLSYELPNRVGRYINDQQFKISQKQQGKPETNFTVSGWITPEGNVVSSPWLAPPGSYPLSVEYKYNENGLTRPSKISIANDLPIADTERIVKVVDPDYGKQEIPVEVVLTPRTNSFSKRVIAKGYQLIQSLRNFNSYAQGFVYSRKLLEQLSSVLI